MKSLRYEQLVNALKLAEEIVGDRRVEWARHDPRSTPYLALQKMARQLSDMIARAVSWHDNEKCREEQAEKRLRDVEQETAYYPLTWEEQQEERELEEVDF